MTYQLIGEGSYGCVYKPSLPCSTDPPGDNSKLYKNKISKLMLTESALKEIEEYAIISGVDKTDQFYTGKPRKCTVKETPEVERAMKKCKLISKNFKNKTLKDISKKTMLLIIGDGGYDFERWIKILVKSKNPTEEVRDFWKECLRLFRALLIFKTNDIVHHDLKPQNLVYRPETKSVRIIDFGLMRSIKSENSKCKEIKSCKGSSHWNYPTEIVFMNKREYGILANQSVKERESTFEKYMNALRKKSNLSFVTAFEIMIEYIFKREDKERRKIFSDKYWMAWRDLLLSISKENYNEFLDKTLYGFDMFGLGLSFLYILSRVKQFMPPNVVNSMNELFFKMMTPNVFVRIKVEDALNEYERIIAELS